MQTYRPLQPEERGEISHLYRAGGSVRQIAATHDRSPSTIAREIKHNQSAGGNYSALYADQKTRARRQAA